MKKHLIIFFLFAVVIINPSVAQTDSLKVKKTPKNAVFLRLGTIAAKDADAFYSLDYDRVILAKKKIKLTMSIGISYSWMHDYLRISSLSLYYNSIAIPYNINFLYYVGKNFNIESGVGVTYSTPYSTHNICNYYKNYLFLSINPLGFRYVGKKGFTSFCKVGYMFGDFRWLGGDVYYDSNCYNTEDEIKFYPNIHFGFGYSF